MANPGGQNTRRHGNLKLISREKARPAVLLACILVAVARFPRAVFGAQLWAEDGAVFIQSAFDQNVALVVRLFQPYAGALYLYQRIVAEVAVSWLPLAWLATVFAAAALACQLAPAFWLLGKRFEVLPGTGWKVAAAALLTLLPNSHETYASLTNVGWYTPLLVGVIVLTRQSERRLVAGVEALIVLVATLTGPLTVFFLPLLVAARGRSSLRDPRVLAAALGCAAQVAMVMSSKRLGHSAFDGDLGPVLRFMMARHYVAGHLGSTFSKPSWQVLTKYRSALNSLPLYAALAVALVKSRCRPALAFGVFGAAVALLTCLTFDTTLELLLGAPDTGLRYSFPSTWGFAFAELMALANFPPRRPAYAAIAGVHLAILTLVAVPADFRITGARARGPSWSEELESAQRVAAPGAPLLVPIGPPGWGVQIPSGLR